MSLSVQSLNGDTSFLLTFDPPAAPPSSPGLFPGSFTILVDRKLVQGLGGASRPHLFIVACDAPGRMPAIC